MWKKLFLHFVLSLVTDYARRGRQLVRIEGARYYVQAVASIRQFFNYILLCIACLFLAQIGLAFVVYGLVTSLTLDPETRALSFLLIGAAMFSLPLIAMLIFNSERQWSRKTGVPDLVASVIPEQELELRRKNRANRAHF